MAIVCPSECGGALFTHSPVGCSYLPVAGVSSCTERDMMDISYS